MTAPKDPRTYKNNAPTPPYSPELNPVERLWRYLKDHTLKNKVYDTLNELESVVSSFITSIPAHAIISDYNWEIVLVRIYNIFRRGPPDVLRAHNLEIRDS